MSAICERHESACSCAIRLDSRRISMMRPRMDSTYTIRIGLCMSHVVLSIAAVACACVLGWSLSPMISSSGGTTCLWNVFWNPGAKSTANWPISWHAAYRTRGCGSPRYCTMFVTTEPSPGSSPSRSPSHIAESPINPAWRYCQFSFSSICGRNSTSTGSTVRWPIDTAARSRACSPKSAASMSPSKSSDKNCQSAGSGSSTIMPKPTMKKSATKFGTLRIIPAAASMSMVRNSTASWRTESASSTDDPSWSMHESTSASAERKNVGLSSAMSMKNWSALRVTSWSPAESPVPIVASIAGTSPS
eukprot:Amastigsp_a1894_129.p3 type:complete len:304 gc:universal Amastigsp_a1894_129:1768-2679(+)